MRFRKSGGQSLVEVALFLPLALVIIAGLVEISQWLLVQNRINTAARASARFGANGGKDEGMAAVALGTVTQTLPIDPNLWDIWTVRGTLNDDGSDIITSTFNYVHVYGNGNTQRYGEFSTQDFEGDLKAQILKDLQSDIDSQGNIVTSTTSVRSAISGIQFVGSYVQYDAESILGLDNFVDNFFSVRDLAVMRTFPSGDRTGGCDSFPIAVHRDARSVALDDWPTPREFTYPNQSPQFDDFVPPHVANVPLEEARRGYLYLVQQGDSPGTFGWLKWNEDLSSSSNNLAVSLTWPGVSKDYITEPQNASNSKNSAWATVGFSQPVKGYMEPGNPTDQSMHIGDLVLGLTGSVNSNKVNTALQDLINYNRHLRLIIWDVVEGSGNNSVYQIYGFAIFKFHGYRLNQGSGESWILAEFIQWDRSCGQVQTGNIGYLP